MRALLRDYLATAAAQWTTLGVGLLLFHLVARRDSATGFAYYQIARGVVAAAQPIAMLGLAPGLHRYLPRVPLSARRLARQALAVQLAAAVVVVVAGALLSGWLRHLLGLTGSALAVAVLLAGNCLCTLAVAALRGNGQILQSNLALLTGLAVIPLFCWFAVTAVDSFLIAQGLGMAAAALLATLTVHPRDIPSASTSRSAAAPGPAPAALRVSPSGPDCVSPAAGVAGTTRPVLRGSPADPDSIVTGSDRFAFPDRAAGVAGREVPRNAIPSEPGLVALVRYGLRRTPGDLALPALLAFPTFAVANALPGGPQAGYVGFTASGVTFICSFYAMLTPVLLPRLSAHFHAPGDTSPHRLLTVLPAAAAAVAALIVLGLIVVAPRLVHAYLGAEFGGAIRTLRLGVVAAVGFAAFYAARPAVDAVQEVTILTRFVLITLVLEVVLTFLLRLAADPLTAALVALDLSAFFLGTSSYIAMIRILRNPHSARVLSPARLRAPIRLAVFRERRPPLPSRTHRDRHPSPPTRTRRTRHLPSSIPAARERRSSPLTRTYRVHRLSSLHAADRGRRSSSVIRAYRERRLPSVIRAYRERRPLLVRWTFRGRRP